MQRTFIVHPVPSSEYGEGDPRIGGHRILDEITGSEDVTVGGDLMKVAVDIPEDVRVTFDDVIKDTTLIQRPLPTLLQLWEFEMSKLDPETPRGLEDIYDAMTPEQQSKVNQFTTDRILAKKRLRQEKPS